MRNLIENGWIQGMLATQADGEQCSWDDPRATHFCLAGALHRAARQSLISYSVVNAKVMSAARKLQFDIPEFMGIYGFNDDHARTQADILAVLDYAIAHC